MNTTMTIYTAPYIAAGMTAGISSFFSIICSRSIKQKDIIPKSGPAKCMYTEVPPKTILMK